MHVPSQGVLYPYKTWPAKTTERKKKDVFYHASGLTGPRGSKSSPVVEFTDDGECKPGPSAQFYERSRAAAGAHLMFNAFWMVSTFCIYQMYMRDSLHQVDHGIIVHIMRAILRLFQGEI